MRPFLPLAFACALTVVSAPSLAGEVTDVLALPGGAVFVVLDETPLGLSADASEGRLSVTLDGFTAAPRMIAPYGEAPFSRLSVLQTGFVLEGRFAGAVAELRDGGVLIRFGDTASMDGATPPPARLTREDAETALGGDSEPTATSYAEASAGMASEAAPEPASEVSSGMAPGTASGTAPETPSAAAITAARARDAEAARRRSSSDTMDAGAGEAAPEAPSNAAATNPQPASGPCDAAAAALADAPWDLDLIVDQADCLVEAGQGRNAAGLYERVLAFQPEHFRAALGLARLRQQAGRHDDAARLFETAAGSAMTDGEALSALAAARRAREQGGR